jgi:PAS domain S-box-containing protein
MYKSLFEEVPCYLTVVSRDYRIVRANRAFRDQFGDHVGEMCFAGYKGLDSRCADCPVEKTFSDGLSHQSEEVWKVNGDDAYVIVNTAPIFDDEGNIAEVLEMSLDVTKLKQLQLELQKRQEEYKYLFENVPCYLTVVDRDFNVIQANEQFETDFGKHIGKKCFSVYKRRESKCEDCPVAQTFIDGASHSSEHLWLRNGEETNIIATTAPVRNDKGEITAVMEMCTNITEIKRLQSELALLGETIAGMSHTIKNILSGLQGGVYVVDSGLARGKEEKVRQGWDMVKRNVEKISDLVQGILYASKERKPEYRECDPGELLWEVCDLYEAKVRSEGVELVREFEREMGSVPLDPAGIHSAVANLLSNAVEACRTMRDRPPRITVTGRLEDKVLAIRVSDNGIGMPQEVKERLFGRFYSTKGSRGTGLGLVITKKVIEEHGGTVRVESETGQGTSFIIEIPFELARKDSGLRRAV